MKQIVLAVLFLLCCLSLSSAGKQKKLGVTTIKEHEGCNQNQGMNVELYVDNGSGNPREAIYLKPLGRGHNYKVRTNKLIWFKVTPKKPWYSDPFSALEYVQLFRKGKKGVAEPLRPKSAGQRNNGYISYRKAGNDRHIWFSHRFEKVKTEQILVYLYTVCSPKRCNIAKGGTCPKEIQNISVFGNNHSRFRKRQLQGKNVNTHMTQAVAQYFSSGTTGTDGTGVTTSLTHETLRIWITGPKP